MVKSIMKNKILFIIFLFVILILFLIFAIRTGSVDVNFKKIMEDIFNKNVDSTIRAIIMEIRLPRIVISILIGGLLAISGVILQSILKNPLADPFITGISSGAALGASIAIISGFFNITFFAFLTSFLTMLFIYRIALINGKINIISLLLIGVMTGSFLSSVVMLLSAVFNRDLVKVLFWLMGDLSGCNIFYVNVTLIFSIIIFLLCFIFSYDLNILSLGEEEAKTLGVNVEFVKGYYFILSSIIVAFCVSLSGVIGFIGLVVPHIMRYFVGFDTRFLLPASFLGGGLFLLLADTLARSLFLPGEIPVGIITGLIGAPVFILLVLKRKKI